MINAREIGTRAQDPCAALLSREDLVQLGLDPATARPSNFAQALNCDWDHDGNKDLPSLTLTTTPGRNVLVDVYRARVMRIFTPITIVGLPAVLETSVPDDFICIATVGVNDDEGTAAIWHAQQPLDPPTEACDNATKALAAVVAHLPPR